MQEANIQVPRTHNLEELLSLIVSTFSAWNSWQTDFSTLSNHAVNFRYPGKTATEENVSHAVKTCEMVRKSVRVELKLPANEAD